MHHPSRSIACLTLAAAASAALAQSTQPAAPPHATLQLLDRETKALYADVQQSVVRISLPPPKWVKELATQGNPLEKWKGELAPEVRQKLEEHVKSAQEGELHDLNAAVTATSQPATAPVVPPPPAVRPNPGGSVTILAPVRVGEQIQWRPLRITFSNHVGVVMDDRGHVLVPLFVEREVVGQRKLPVLLGDGRTVGARFVGSDRMMNLTVLQMDQPLGRPVRVAAGKPADGAMILMVSPNTPPVARLLVWTGGHQEMGLVAGMDGGVWGFARFGHFLKLDDARPVVEQLVQHGEVKRAQLGVWVQEVPPQDPLRQQNTLLGNRPALKVLDVTADSAAHRAGLKVDDLILTLSGDEVGDTTSFAIAISRSTGPTELRIIRAGAEAVVRVDLKPQ
jgi:S1-C subfamily serine protease